MKVSVVIPCYNVEKYLSGALKSVQAQDHEDIEIICVNDGSVDNTLPLLYEYQSEFAPNMQIVDQVNRGAASARNAGLAVAAGEYIQFLDADDVLLPGKISQQIRVFHDARYAGFVAGGYERRYPDGTVEKLRQFPADSQGNPWLDLIEGNLGNTCANLFRRSALDSVGGWQDGLESSQECDLMFRLLKKGINVAYDNEVNTIINIRADGSSITQNNLEANAERFLGLRAEMIDYLSREKISVDLRSAYKSFIRVLHDKKASGSFGWQSHFEVGIPAELTSQQA